MDPTAEEFRAAQVAENGADWMPKPKSQQFVCKREEREVKERTFSETLGVYVHAAVNEFWLSPKKTDTCLTELEREADTRRTSCSR